MEQLHARSGCIYIIGCLLRPGTLSFATELEHTYFPPDEDINELYNIFQLQYCEMPYFIVEIPQSSYTIAEKLAHKLNLRMVNGKPSSTRSTDQPFGLVCNAESCHTLESLHSNENARDWSSQLKEEQTRVRQCLKMTPTCTDINDEQKSN